MDTTQIGNKIKEIFNTSFLVRKRAHTVRPHKGIMPIPEMLTQSAKNFGNKLAMQRYVNEEWEKWTYNDLDKMVTRLAGGLQKLGLKSKDHIGVLGENRPQWCMAYLAVQRMGGVCVPLDSMMSDTEIRHIIFESGVKAVLTTAKFLGTVLDAERPELIIIDIDNGDRSGTLKFDEILLDEGSQPEFPQIDLDDLAAIIFTSGTTGYSKGVMLSHRNIMSNVASVNSIIHLDENSSLVSVLPLHHTFEATAGFLFPLYIGATITYARSLKSKELLEDIANTGTNLMVGVPLLYEKMYQGINRKLKQLPFFKKIMVDIFYQTTRGASMLGKKDLGKVLFKSLREKAGLNSIKYFVSGGAALPPYIAQFFNYLGICLFQGYGLTETSPVLTVNYPDDPQHESAGLPIPGVELKIFDTDANGIGEIAARGENIFLGYYQNPEATKETFRDGWFLTGDLGWIDHEGFLYITGRKKNLLVTGGGKNVYPEEIEALLNQKDHILESLVIGVPRPGGMGDEVEALIVPDNEFFDKEKEEIGIIWTPEKKEEVIKQEVEEVCTRLAEYKRIHKFSIHEEEFVKTSTKKIKRYLYQQKYLDVNSAKPKKK